MGYKRNPKIYKLTFGEDTDYAGLEVQVRGLSMGQLIAMKSGKTEGDKGPDEEFTELLAERLVSWNLEDEDGTPVPTTLEALNGEDVDMVLTIIRHWSEAVGGVSDPLPQSSPSGEPSLVESVPMEALSESLAS